MKRTIIKILIMISTVTLTFSVLSIETKAQGINPDTNADLMINPKDIEELSKYYNGNNATYDFNKDGIVDIYDKVMVSKYINNDPYKVYNSIGIYQSTHMQGKLTDAVKSSTITNGKVVLNTTGATIWDKLSYYAFNDELLSGKYSNMYDAIKNTNSLVKGRVYSKYGTELLNNSTNFKRTLGVTNVDGLNFRTGPGTSYAKISTLSSGVMVEVLGKNSGFYKVNLYNQDGTYTLGYLHQLYLDIIQDDKLESNFGYIAAKYESNMDPGAIGDHPDDKGGVSFGMFQLSSNMGSLASFMIWLQGQNTTIYNILNNAKIVDGNTYGTNYRTAWGNIANNYYEEFYRLQLKYVKGEYYDGFIRVANNNNFDVSKIVNYYSTRNMIFSTSIQHGPTGAYNLIYTIDRSLSMASYVQKVYDNRLYRVSLSYPAGSTIYEGIKSRYIQESSDIMRSYNREISY